MSLGIASSWYNLWGLAGLAFVYLCIYLLIDWKLAFMFSKGNFVQGAADA